MEWSLMALFSDQCRKRNVGVLCVCMRQVGRVGVRGMEVDIAHDLTLYV